MGVLPENPDPPYRYPGRRRHFVHAIGGGVTVSGAVPFDPSRIPLLDIANSQLQFWGRERSVCFGLVRQDDGVHSTFSLRSEFGQEAVRAIVIGPETCAVSPCGQVGATSGPASATFSNLCRQYEPGGPVP
jgi:hypothetical protein